MQTYTRDTILVEASSVTRTILLRVRDGSVKGHGSINCFDCDTLVGVLKGGDATSDEIIEKCYGGLQTLSGPVIVAQQKRRLVRGFKIVSDSTTTQLATS